MSATRRVVIITGGSTGIGYGIARALAEPDTALILAQVPRLLTQAKQASAELAPAEAIALAVDVRDDAAVERMLDFVIERFGQVDILVNNASITGPTAIASFLDTSRTMLDEIVDVNLKGAFFCSQAVARRMVARKAGGNIVHIASVGAFAAQESASVYCATKAALTSLAQTMALELAAHQIRVNCVAPGDIETPASASMPSARSSHASQRYQRITPLGRRGQPQDVGNAVAYLVSEKANFITGATLIVDGGFLAY